MSTGKAARAVVNNLIQAFKLIELDSDQTDFDILQPHYNRLAPSGRRFRLNRSCIEAIGKATSKVQEVIGSYPRHNAFNSLTDVVVAVRDLDVLVENAYEELMKAVTEWVQTVNSLGQWEVLIAIRGIQHFAEPFRIGRCEFYRMDDKLFALWGQRWTTGQYDPPSNSGIFRDWFSQESQLIGQTVTLAKVNASDCEHANFEAFRVINETLDLIRYGQVQFGMTDGVAPQIGLSPDPNGVYFNSHSICIRHDEWEMRVNKGVGPQGAFIDHCKLAPAWNEIEEILNIEPENRNEMQRRIILSLGWVGQAALATSLPIKLVAITTALETLLIEDSESLGKKSKMSSRVAAFPKLLKANGHIDEKIARQIYEIRCGCLHAGFTEVEESDFRNAALAIAQCFSGLLKDDNFRRCETISDLICLISTS